MESRTEVRKVSNLSILFTDDQQIQKLNSQYRKKDRPTDVLSFSQLELTKNHLAFSLGDLVISLNTAEKQAKKLQVTLQQEILRLLIHGILHLFGFDHENVPISAARKMRQLENLIFSDFKSAAREFVKAGK